VAQLILSFGYSRDTPGILSYLATSRRPLPICCHNGVKHFELTSHTLTVGIHQKTTSHTLRTAPKWHLWATTMVNCRKRLNQLHPTCSYHIRNLPTWFLDELGLFAARPVHSDRFSSWQQQTGSGVLELFPVWQTCFLNGLRLAEIGLVEYQYGVFSRWQTRSSFLLRIFVSITWFTEWVELSEPSTTWFHPKTW